MYRRNIIPSDAQKLAIDELNKSPKDLLVELYKSAYEPNIPANTGMFDITARYAVLQCVLAERASSDAANAARENKELQTTIKNYTKSLLVLTWALMAIGIIQLIGMVFQIYVSLHPINR